MIDVKVAAGAAATYFSELTSATDIRLEEVELSDDERRWSVTLSGVPPPSTAASAASTLAAFMGGEQNRLYKVFTIDAETGVVRSMKIRKI